MSRPEPIFWEKSKSEGTAIVIGGTGTLGKALIKQLLFKTDYKIVCVSRCELKQKQLKAELASDRVTYKLGDVRDAEAMLTLTKGATAVFLVAALKHVDTLEENPLEAIKTNVLGTQNVIDAVRKNGVAYLSFCSTDKAVEPVNAYGMSKALAEKLLLSFAKEAPQTVTVFRWGNVIGSRGSVIHEFVRTLKESNSVNITNLDMTRFWILIEDAAQFMVDNHKVKTQKVLIPPMKASYVTDLAAAVAKVVEKDSFQIKKIPIRPGEKLHEKLDTNLDSKTAPQYTMSELEGLVRMAL